MTVATIYAVMTKVPVRCADCAGEGMEYCEHAAEMEPARMVIEATFEPPSDNVRDCILEARMAVMMAARRKVSGPYE